MGWTRAGSPCWNYSTFVEGMRSNECRSSYWCPWITVENTLPTFPLSVFGKFVGLAWNSLLIYKVECMHVCEWVREWVNLFVTDKLGSLTVYPTCNLIVNSSPRSSILVIVYITSSLQKPMHTAVIVLEKDNTPSNYPILNSCSLKTVSSIDVFTFRWLHSASQSDVFSEFCAYCLYCSFNSTFYFV